MFFCFFFVLFKDPESADAQAFTKVASKIDDVPFAITSNADIFKEHGLEKDGILLYKKVTLIKAGIC